MRTTIENAVILRTAHAQAEHILTGYVDLAVRTRPLFAVLANDPSVGRMMRTHPEWGELVDRQVGVLAGVEPGPAGFVNAAMMLSGIAGASRTVMIDIDDEELRRHLMSAGRRALGLRTPPTPPTGTSSAEPPTICTPQACVVEGADKS